jgi:hypothetical protein
LQGVLCRHSFAGSASLKGFGSRRNPSTSGSSRMRLGQPLHRAIQRAGEIFLREAFLVDSASLRQNNSSSVRPDSTDSGWVRTGFRRASASSSQRLSSSHVSYAVDLGAEVIVVTARCVMLNDETWPAASPAPLRLPSARLGAATEPPLSPDSFKPLLQGYPLPRRETPEAQTTAWVRLPTPSLRLLNILPLCITSQNDVCGRVGRVIRRMCERSP